MNAAPPDDDLAFVLPVEMFVEPLRTWAAGSRLVTLPPLPPAPHKHRPRGLPPGTIIDKYRVECLLGTGAFAAVYRVTHLLLDAPFALKLLHRRVLRDNPQAVAMLISEARHLARLDHPNIAKMFDVTHHGEVAYLVLELVPGRDLGETLRQRRLNLPQALRVALQVCRGLQAALALGVIHRDIKPSNIVLTPEGHAKIVDLGFALGPIGEPGAPRLAGTPHYMAPEQAARAEVDFRSDIYALGITLYHALFGQVPFRYDSADDVRAHRRDTPVPLPTEWLSGKLAGVGQLLRWMTAPRAADRPRTYQQLESALLSQLDGA